MKSNFDVIRGILFETSGMTAREILRDLKQLGEINAENSGKWEKKDVNSVLYKLLGQGEVQKEFRDSLRPYWKLTSSTSSQTESLRQNSNKSSTGLGKKPFGKSNNELKNKINSIFEEYGALYLDEIQEFLEIDFHTLENSFPWHKKFVIDLNVSSESWKKWTEEETIEAVRKASTYYFPLTGPNYQSLIEIGEIQGPGIQRIYKQFGWPEICKAAGVEIKSAPRTEYERTWSDEELLSFVLRFLQSAEESDSYQTYSKWKNMQIDHVPNIQSITKYLGTWSLVRNKALESLRTLKGKELK